MTEGDRDKGVDDKRRTFGCIESGVRKRERETDREQDKERKKRETKEYRERVIGTLRKQDKAK